MCTAWVTWVGLSRMVLTLTWVSRQVLQDIGGLRSIGFLHESLKINLSDNSYAGNTLLKSASFIPFGTVFAITYDYMATIRRRAA
jgi:hypothetical protein